jgi:hypothetical protein
LNVSALNDPTGKAGFFSPIRRSAAIAKKQKSQVASFACLGSLARGCGIAVCVYLVLKAVTNF